MEPRIIDTHCHVHFAAYDADSRAVIEEALAAGIHMIVVGTQATTSKNAVVCAEQFGGVYAAVGLHPNHLHTMPIDEDELPTFLTRAEEFEMEYYRELAKHPKVVGIGETGFDAYRLPDGVSFDEVMQKQEKAFRQHLDLCTELGKPVIVHCRDAHSHVIRIFKEYLAAAKLDARGVLHCFTGTVEEAQEYVAMGFYISLSGIVTFPARKGQTENPLSSVARSVPRDKLVIETDSPYLTPMPHRGKRNAPSYVIHTAKHVAQLWGTTLEEVERQTTVNARRLFRI